MAVFLIGVTAALIYSNTFHSPFVFDDLDSILNNSKIRKITNFYTLKTLQSPRPLVDYTFALNYHFGQLNVFGYHLVNLLIHIANGILVFFLSSALLRKLNASDEETTYPAALFAALIFIAHPVQTQAVTYIAQRYASMAAFFYMVSVLGYLAARDAVSAGKSRAGGAYFLTAFLSGGLAFLCKQNAASFPLALLLTEFACYDQSWKGWKKKLAFILPGMLLIGCFYVFNMGLFRHDIHFSKLLEDVSEITQDTRRIGRWQYLCTQFNVICNYIRLLLFPIHQNLDYLYPIKTGFFDGATPYAFAFLGGLVFFGWRCRKTHPAVFYGIFWFFITLSVESSIFPIKDALFEHRLYLPMFGFSLIAARAAGWLAVKRRIWAHAAILASVLSLSAAAYARNAVWRDGVTLWSDVVSKSPSNYRALNNLGNDLMMRGDFDAAMIDFDTAIRLNPAYYITFVNKGILLAKMGKPDEAIPLFKRVLAINPNFAAARQNLSIACMEKADGDFSSGRYTDAIPLYEESLRLDPQSLKVHTNLGVAYIRTGRMGEAIEQFKMAQKIDPGSFETAANLGMALYAGGNREDALRQLRAALRINPASKEVRQVIDQIVRSTGSDSK